MRWRFLKLRAKCKWFAALNLPLAGGGIPYEKDCRGVNHHAGMDKVNHKNFSDDDHEPDTENESYRSITFAPPQDNLGF